MPYYDLEGTIFRLTFFELPFIIVFLYEIYVINIILKKTRNRPEYKEDKKVILMYPLTLFSCWILIILVRLIEIIIG